MTKPLPKRERHWTEDFPRDKALELCQERFGSDGWRDLQDTFKKLNKRFFDGVLPDVFIFSGSNAHTDRAAGRYYGRAIFVASNSSEFERHLILFHEMAHLNNRLRDIYDGDHGISWVDSLQHIHEKLNIKIQTKDFVEAEALTWPFDLFKNYGLYAYFEKSFAEYGELRPLPSGWRLEKVVRPERDQQIEVICTGNALADTKALKQAFGAEYISKFKEILCNTRS